MTINLTKAQAETWSTAAAGAGVAALVTGAALVDPVVIALGAAGAVIAAIIKLGAKKSEEASQNATQAYSPSNHPMRRAEDREAEDHRNQHVGAGR